MAARKIVNLLRGSVRLEVSGAFPERFLNLCAQKAVAFWAVEWPEDHVLRLTVAWQDRKGLDELAQRTGCTVAEAERKGVPPFLIRFRKRYALLAGLALALAAVCFLSRFVLVVEVEGNETVPTQVILTELRRAGLRPGAYGPGLATREISNEALLRLEDLSWMAVNLHGIRAQVVVREKVAKPEIVDRSQLGDIVASSPRWRSGPGTRRWLRVPPCSPGTSSSGAPSGWTRPSTAKIPPCGCPCGLWGGWRAAPGGPSPPSFPWRRG